MKRITLFLAAVLLMFCAGAKAQDAAVAKHLEQDFDKAVKANTLTPKQGRDLLSVNVNRNDRIMVNEVMIRDAQLEGLLVDFIKADSPKQSPTKVKKNILLLGSVEVSQGVILIVYDSQAFPDKVKEAVLHAFERVRDEKAMLHFKVGYARLNTKQRLAIDELVPMRLNVRKYVPKGDGKKASSKMEVRDDFAIPELDISDVNEENVEVLQIEGSGEEDEPVFVVVEESPEFPGGMDAMVEFISSHLKYPKEALENHVTGKVFVIFTVDKDGSITNARVLRDIGSGCGEEALRVVNAMPKWNPGKQKGKPVRVQFTLPVNFILQ